jgi:uncharacterized membrane protein
MIWDTDVNSKKNGMYEETIKNLERAKQILDERLANKTVSDSEYVQKTKELDAQIQKYKAMMGA